MNFENLYIKYIDARGSIGPILPNFDTKAHYSGKDSF